MEYKDIDKVNGEIKMLDLKGKSYAMVPERVTAFRKLFPEGFIKTEIVSHDGTTVLMQAVAGYYENGVPVILGSGFAQEVKGKGMVNGTSYIENCETSAVGRALGMIGLGINGGGICSAEELANAVTAQRQMKEEKFENYPLPENGKVTAVTSLPNVSNPVKEYLANELGTMMELFGISDKRTMMSKFTQMRKALIDGKVIEDIPSDKQTMEQAVAMVDAIYKNFKPSGDEA